jgi:hypothetical protein
MASVLQHRADEIYAPFSVVEVRRLRTFAGDVERFLASAFFKDLKLSATLGTPDGMGGLTESLEYPGEEAVHAVSGLFRSLYNHKDPASFHKTLNLLSEHVRARKSPLEDQALGDSGSSATGRRKRSSPRASRST